jgi:hypothetical protein
MHLKMKYSDPLIYTENETKNYGIPSEYLSKKCALIHLFSRIKPNYVKYLPSANKFTIHGVKGRVKQDRNPSNEQFMQTNEPRKYKVVQLISVRSRSNGVMALAEDTITDSVI